jgi:hypothetical protein
MLGRHYLDFVDNVKSVGVACISKVYLHQGIRKPIAIVGCARKGVSEICVWILHTSMTSQDYESGDTDTASSQIKRLGGKARFQ